MAAMQDPYSCPPLSHAGTRSPETTRPYYSAVGYYLRSLGDTAAWDTLPAAAAFGMSDQPEDRDDTDTTSDTEGSGGLDNDGSRSLQVAPSTSRGPNPAVLCSAAPVAEGTLAGSAGADAAVQTQVEHI